MFASHCKQQRVRPILFYNPSPAPLPPTRPTHPFQHPCTLHLLPLRVRYPSKFPLFPCTQRQFLYSSIFVFVFVFFSSFFCFARFCFSSSNSPSLSHSPQRAEKFSVGTVYSLSSFELWSQRWGGVRKRATIGEAVGQRGGGVNAICVYDAHFHELPIKTKTIRDKEASRVGGGGGSGK